MENQIDPNVLERANNWLAGNYDRETKIRVKELLENDPKELTEAFYKNLEFGTGGLRGIMGVGTNRMNKYTVGMSTQGLANYLKQVFKDEAIRAAIAYDSRNNSRYFAQITADVLSANGIHVYLFDDIRPTPELSYTIRLLKCHTGVVVTASHNPKEYNGYKVYWNDGGQLVPPHDINVITEVQRITNIDDVRFDGNPELIELIGEQIDISYIDKLKTLSLIPELKQAKEKVKIVYTPLHGTGTKLVPMALEAFGFTNVISIDEQSIPDGNFPTVKSPNPEEHEAMNMALKKANEIQADLVLATDPDADRVGVGIRNDRGKYILLNGNQTASILVYYLAHKFKESGKLTGKEYIVKTIVTSELLRDIATRHGIACYEVLTGFKYIAEVIRGLEGKEKFIGGGEESYGLLVGEYVRDKDAVISSCIMAEIAAWAKSQGKAMFDILVDIYLQYGFYHEELLSVTKKGKEGAEAIKNMMDGFRKNPPATLDQSDVVIIKDYQSRVERNLEKGFEKPIKLPKSNVLQFVTADGSIATVRPSGTEPKIKFYFGVKKNLASAKDYHAVKEKLALKVKRIMADLGL